MAKIGRNRPCPCGSGKKYKRCHGLLLGTGSPSPPLKLKKIFELDKKTNTGAAEILRIQQQGHGNQIESFEHEGQRFVVAGQSIYHSSKWKTFIDFLSTYILRELSKEWFTAEAAKPIDQRNTISMWLDEIKSQEVARGSKPGEVQHITITGAACCFFGLAYNLYLLDHNAELQKRYLDRLQNNGNLQGAYYELLVANVLIRAGFALELEDETDIRQKHCEFSATSKRTGRKYWVEAKMRGVCGLLGRTDKDGVSPKERDPTSRMTTHIAEALGKPAEDERLIFVDLNADVETTPTGEPAWMAKAVRRLDSRERNLSDGQTAYVFVTNLAFHRYLSNDTVGRETLAYGLGLPDFSKPGYRRILDMYRNKQKHIDAYDVMAALQTYPCIPSTFDGSLPSEAFGGIRSLKIGETYFFDNIEGGVLAKVTGAIMDEPEKLAYVTVITPENQSFTIAHPVTDEQMEDYRRHPNVFFGEVNRNGAGTNNPLEFFEWMLGVYTEYPKSNMLRELSSHPDIEAFKTLSQPELAEALAEIRTVQTVQKANPGSLLSQDV